MFIEYLILQKFNEMLIDLMQLIVFLYIEKKNNYDWNDFNKKRDDFKKMFEKYIISKSKNTQLSKDLKFFNLHLSRLENLIKDKTRISRKKVEEIIIYLIRNDIPGIIKAFSEYESYLNQYYSFFKSLEPLIIEGKTDSAIRESFVEYSNFLRKFVKEKYINKRDGHKLLDKVFDHDSSLFKNRITTKEKETLTNIYRSIYEYIRHPFAHGKTESDKVTFNFVISTLIWSIKEITEIKKRRKRTIQK